VCFRGDQNIGIDHFHATYQGIRPCLDRLKSSRVSAQCGVFQLGMDMTRSLIGLFDELPVNVEVIVEKDHRLRPFSISD